MMDYINEAKKTIRDIWFKNHVVKSIKGEKGFQEIIFGEQGTSLYQVKYVLSGNMVYISGDLGVAAYELTGLATIDEISRYNLHYFTGKLVALKRDIYNFNSKLAVNEIRNYFLERFDVEFISELDANDRALYIEMVDAAKECSSINHFNSAIYSIYQQTNVEWFDGEIASMFAEFGRELSYSVIAYWLGIQMISELLGQSKQIEAVVV